jgi:hypothetical protein
MLRRALCGVALVLLGGSGSLAQDWANKMFDGLQHDFGTVARGAKVEHRFVLTNLYKEDIHISGVRSSCGCTSPEITRQTLKTYEKSEIIAKFNTHSFLGQKSATVTVTIDQPYFAEVQLQIAGYIRSDVVLSPGAVELGSVDQGKTAEKKIKVHYAGRDDWRITGVKSANPSLDATATEVSRGGGQVVYELAVRLKEGAPVGYVKEQLTVLTNDRRATSFPVDVQGKVVPELSVASSLMLGTLNPGQQVKKQIVVKGKTPFHILAVECDNPAFQFQVPSEAKSLHLVPFTFTAGETAGKVSQKIVIKTDLGDGPVLETTAYAQITGGTASRP